MPIWEIKYKSGGSDGKELDGCIISQTATQTQLTASDGTTKLGTVTSTTPTITFASFSLPGVIDRKFSLSITSFTSGPLGNDAAGTWANSVPGLGSTQNGDWTAQAGIGIEDEAKEGPICVKAAAAEAP